ncbi:MAG TPA: PAS domain S-box protein [Nitrospirae bacterium]|nr:PAS domain S-box protein [Nitrospirota bacterium]
MTILLFLLAIIIVVLSLWLVNIYQKIHEIKNLVESFQRGDLRKRLYLKGKGGLTEIAQGLNQLAERCLSKDEEKDIQRERLLSILMSLPDGVVVLDRDKKTVLANTAFLDLFRITDYEIEGKAFTDIIRVPEVLDMIDTTYRERELSLKEFYYDITSRYLQVIGVPNKMRSGIVLIFRDISEMKRVEEVRRDFIANVSHELKTPITNIRGYTETLLEGAIHSRDDALRFLGTIRSNVERMERLITDIMHLSKIEMGYLTIDKRRTDLGISVERVLQLFRKKADEKGIEIINNTTGAEIEADPERLEQILTNLVDNAVKFTEKGYVEVNYEERVLSVRDTGIGIPSKYIPRLGERFFRVDPSRSRQLGGTGLGLAIVKHLVNAHGWQMMIESEVGKGTEVKIIT